jgi:GntR family transcriptional regulator, rspAB operon transcriptional repressor
VGQSLSDYAQARLKRLILDRELAAGTTIVEERLAETLSISRTPLREALTRMAAEGLVVKSGSRSFRVRLVTAPEFFQSMRVRELLEREMVETATGRIPTAALDELRSRIAALVPGGGNNHIYWQADNDLHEIFARQCGNPVMASLVRAMRITARLFEASSPFGRAAADQREHLAILDAAREGQARDAGRAMACHIRNLQQDVMKTLRGANPMDPAPMLEVSTAGISPAAGRTVAAAAPPGPEGRAQ